MDGWTAYLLVWCFNSGKIIVAYATYLLSDIFIITTNILPNLWMNVICDEGIVAIDKYIIFAMLLLKSNENLQGNFGK